MLKFKLVPAYACVCVWILHGKQLEVLCLRWMQNLTFADRYNFFEVFSGEGKVSKVWLLSRMLV